MQDDDPTSGRRLARNQFLERHHSARLRRLRVRRADDRLRDVDAAPNLAVGNPVQGRELDPGTLSERAAGSVYQLDVLRKPHGSKHSRNRELRQPKSGQKLALPEFGYPPAGEVGGVKRYEPKSVDAVLRALDAFYKEHSPELIVAETGISRTSLDRIAGPSKVVGAGFTSGNWDKLMKLPELRAAATRALQPPDASDSEWSAIVPEFGRFMSPCLGWRLCRVMEKLDAADRLVEGISTLEGMVRGLDESDVVKSKARKSKKGKAKRESS